MRVKDEKGSEESGGERMRKDEKGSEESGGERMEEKSHRPQKPLERANTRTNQVGHLLLHISHEKYGPVLHKGPCVEAPLYIRHSASEGQ